MIQDKATKEYTDKIKASVNRADTNTIKPKSKKAKKSKKSKKAEEEDIIHTIFGVSIILLIFVALWHFFSWIMP